MRCRLCNTSIPVPERQGRPAIYCSTKCRVAAHRARKMPLPEVMTSRARWVRHDERKRPLTVFGGPASVSDPRTWSTFDRASRSRAGVGIGFVLGDGIGCIDLDHCIEGGSLAPWAAEIVASNRADALLVERSRSGSGVHIFLPMREGPGRKIRDGVRNVETYSAARYIAVTGDRM